MSLEHTGDYRVIFANAAGDSVTSDVAHLEVLVAPFQRVNPDELGDAGYLGQGFPYWIDMNQDGWMDVLLTRDLTAPLAYESQGGGTFVGVANELTKLNKRWYTAAYWTDIDADGDLDCLLPEIGGQHTFFVSQASDGTPDYIVRQQQWTPGVYGSFVDYDNDGWVDLAMTHWWSHGGSSGDGFLARNQGGQFGIANATGFEISAGIEWHSWIDYDEDGDLDFFGATSGDSPQDVLLANQGNGKFARITSHVLVNQRSQNIMSAWGDYDNDGYLDLLVGPRISGGPVESVLYANQLPEDGQANHWLKVTLKGKASNPNGFGAKVRVQAEIGGKTVRQMRQLGIMGGCCSSDFTAHFGLGNAATIDTLRIEWPSGIVQELKDVAVNQHLEVVESQGVEMTEPLVIQNCNRRSTTVSCPIDGVCCVLETSVDLEHWSKVKIQTSAAGTVKFTYVDTSRDSSRFYRVLVP